MNPIIRLREGPNGYNYADVTFKNSEFKEGDLIAFLTAQKEVANSDPKAYSDIEAEFNKVICGKGTANIKITSPERGNIKLNGNYLTQLTDLENDTGVLSNDNKTSTYNFRYISRVDGKSAAQEQIFNTCYFDVVDFAETDNHTLQTLTMEHTIIESDNISNSLDNCYELRHIQIGHVDVPNAIQTDGIFEDVYSIKDITFKKEWLSEDGGYVYFRNKKTPLIYRGQTALEGAGNEDLVKYDVRRLYTLGTEIVVETENLEVKNSETTKDAYFFDPTDPNGLTFNIYNDNFDAQDKLTDLQLAGYDANGNQIFVAVSGEFQCVDDRCQVTIPQEKLQDILYVETISIAFNDMYLTTAAFTDGYTGEEYLPITALPTRWNAEDRPTKIIVQKTEAFVEGEFFHVDRVSGAASFEGDMNEYGVIELILTHDELIENIIIEGVHFEAIETILVYHTSEDSDDTYMVGQASHFVPVLDVNYVCTDAEIQNNGKSTALRTDREYDVDISVVNDPIRPVFIPATASAWDKTIDLDYDAENDKYTGKFEHVVIDQNTNITIEKNSSLNTLYIDVDGKRYPITHFSSTDVSTP